MKLIVIKKNLAKRHLLKFMFINLIPAKDKGQRGGGGGEKRAVHIRTMGEVIVILRTRE